jgi:Tol biopolymer transport system component
VFDAEIAPDGETIIYADGTFTGDQFPAHADLRTGALGSLGFVTTPENDATLQAINSPALEFAPALTSDGLTIAFTRAEGRLPFVRFGIWLARRDDVNAAFGEPVLISAISGGLFEAPTFSPDNRALHYHRAENDRYSLWRVSLPSQ